MEPKFKIGDRVRILDGSGIEDYFGGFTDGMKQFVGRECTVGSADRIFGNYTYILKEVKYIWDERGLELVTEPSSEQPSTEPTSTVNHPAHYQGKNECIDVMVALFGIEAVKGFCKCSAYKYRFRADKKNGAEDIEKAEWFETKLIELESEK